MSVAAPDRSALPRFLLVLFALSTPLWVVGAIYHVELFPGFQLFQLPLGMPAVAALLLVYGERGTDGVVALLKRIYDFRLINSPLWYLPILLIYPSIGLVDYWVQRLMGIDIPPPQFSLVVLLGYSTVFFLTYGEELGLTGYLTDPLQQRHTALTSGLILGVLWAAYHIPGFIISGYYTPEWIFWHAVYLVAGRVLFVWIYNNSGRSLFSMALFHATFGVFWTLWPATGNLQKALPFYDPRIAAFTMTAYVAVVVMLWGPKTLARFRFAPNPPTAASGTRH